MKNQKPAYDGNCLVIGPMANNNIPRLIKEIIAPAFEAFSNSSGFVYKIEHPAQPRPGEVMQQVIELLDEADLVIADITENNPNVFYELGIRHAIGYPCIVIRQKDEENPPFDLAAYRYFEFSFEDLEKSRQDLISVIAEAHKNVTINKHDNNPVTKYYGGPMAEVPSTRGILMGYLRNYLQHCIKATYCGAYLLTVKETTEVSEATPQINKIKIIIPDTLSKTTQSYIQKLVHLKYLLPAEFKTNYKNSSANAARPFLVYLEKGEAGEYTFIDMITPMNALRAKIRDRVDPRPMSEIEKSNLINQLEKKEIFRFRSWLKNELRQLDNIEPGTCDSVEICDWPDHWPEA